MNLETKVRNWFKQNLAHKGKWKLISTLCKDLNLETYKYNFRNQAEYDWNDQVAMILNKLFAEGFLLSEWRGNHYYIKWSGNE